MKNNITRYLSAIMLIVFSFASCTKDLDRKPFYDFTSANVYDDFNNYIEVLAKLYAGFAISGQTGPAGNPDISGIDEGFSNYLRQYWKVQELTTDEAVIAWNDGSLPEYHKMTWSSANEFNRAMYNRIYFEVALANEFIRETTDDKLASRNITGEQANEARQYHAEARFIRALCYYHALDLFGNVPFVTENDGIGAFLPQQIKRADLFNYIESELKEITPELADARTNDYGRADKACAQFLLAKLYLNAVVYTGQDRYADCLSNCSQIISDGYSLEPEYKNLFRTDNNNSAEIIFPINFDGVHTQGYGGMTFLIHAPVGGSMNPADFGINGGWFGLRTTKSFVTKFNDITGATDSRATFYTNGQNLEINDLFNFNDGYAIGKFKNVSSTGVVGSDPTGNFPDTDYPMFRLADVYLMYAEAVLRGGGGDRATALSYINQLRTRAYGNNSGNISDADLTLPFILDERSRELYWEATRRTDLIRYGLFTSSDYLWPWKGGVKEGVAVEDYRNLMPIPSTDIIANPNLIQNPGY